MKRSNPRGFTLVEILIVVIILGILAAIVIPQFTNASSDARKSSVQSTLQTLRGQIELFKIQHGDVAPATVSGLPALLMGKSDPADTVAPNAAGTLGPYVQSFPINPLNGNSNVSGGTGATIGWTYTFSGSQYTISALDTSGGVALSY